jgi:hypothetical protein
MNQQKSVGSQEDGRPIYFIWLVKTDERAVMRYERKLFS